VAGEPQPQTDEIKTHKVVSRPNHQVRQPHCYWLNTNTRTGCRRCNTTTTKTRMAWFLDLKLLFFYSFIDLFWFFFLIFFFFSFFIMFCFVLFLLLLLFFLWWDNDRTITQTPTPGLEAEGVTPELLRLKLYCIWTWDFFSFLSFFFCLLFIFHCLSNACLAHCWLVHYLSLFVSLALYFSSLPSLLSFSSYPSFPDIIIFTITSWIILNNT
jgi:hypothetical protein